MPSRSSRAGKESKVQSVHKYGAGFDYSQEGTINLSKASKVPAKAKGKTSVNPVRVINYGSPNPGTKYYGYNTYYRYDNKTIESQDRRISVSGTRLSNFAKESKMDSANSRRPQSAKSYRQQTPQKPYAFEYVSPYKYKPDPASSSKKYQTAVKPSDTNFTDFNNFYANLNKTKPKCKPSSRPLSNRPNSSSSSKIIPPQPDPEPCPRTERIDVVQSKTKYKKSRKHQSERKRIQALISDPAWDGFGRPELYQFGKTLGQGSFGIVKLAHHKITGHKVAIKIYDKAKFKKPSQLKRSKQEIELMAKLNSNYVSHFFESFEEYTSGSADSFGSSNTVTPINPNPSDSKPSKKIFIVMEALSGGNLCTYVKSQKHLTENEALRILIQILSALEYLHAQAGVVHRDIKLENILFTSTKRVKLADFGFSVFVELDPQTRGYKKLNSFCGTPSYMAPEIIRKKGYHAYPVDIWSLGVVFYAMLFGRFPFRAKNHEELYKLIMKGYFAPPEGHAQTSLLSQDSWRLLTQMINVEPKKRLTVTQLLDAEFVKKLRCSSLMDGMSGSLESNGGKDCLHLVSSNPQDDYKEDLTNQLERFGFSHHRLKKSILNRERNHITATYYLLRMKQGKKKDNRTG